MKEFVIKLTAEQIKQIEENLGREVTELKMKVEDFSVQGTEGTSLIVLKTENVAHINAVGGGGSTVN